MERRLAIVSSAISAWAAKLRVVRATQTTWDRLLGEAGGLVAPVVRRLRPDDRLVVVPMRSGGFLFHRVVGGQVLPVEDDDLAAARGPFELRLRADQCIERTLSLPAASRDYLATVIEHRLERLTPWRRESVMHGYVLDEVDAAAGTLTVRVLMTDAAVVEQAVAALEERGLVVSATGGGADALAMPMPIVLGAGGAASRRPAWLVAAGRVWLAGTGALAALAVAATLWASEAAGRQDEAELHLAKARRLVRDAAGGPLDTIDPLIAAAKRPEVATVLLIDKLATALPDTAFLRELTVTPGEVRMAGTAADAAALVATLERAGLSNVRFTAPVARGDDRRDSFEITADRAAAKEDAP